MTRSHITQSPRHTITTSEPITSTENAQSMKKNPGSLDACKRAIIISIKFWFELFDFQMVTAHSRNSSKPHSYRRLQHRRNDKIVFRMIGGQCEWLRRNIPQSLAKCQYEYAGAGN